MTEFNRKTLKINRNANKKLNIDHISALMYKIMLKDFEIIPLRIHKNCEA